MPKDTPSHLCGRHSHDFTGGLVAGRLRGTRAVQPCETTVVCCLERGMKTCRECRARHIQGEATRWTVERSAKARAKGKGKQGQQERRDKNKGSIECWNCGKRGLYTGSIVGARRTGPTMVVQRERTKTRTQRIYAILTRQSPANSDPEVDMGGFGMSHFNDVNAVEVRELEWIKIGVGAGAGKTAWPRSATYGKRLTFSTAAGELVKSGTRLCVEGCGDWRVNLRVRGVQAVVCKTKFSVGEHTTMGGVAVVYGCHKVTCSTRARVL